MNRQNSKVLSGKIGHNADDLSTYIDKMAEDVVKCLSQRGLKVSFAESCTGGLLAAALTGVPGASGVFECGIVAYSEQIKSDVLGIPKELISECGVVSETVAIAMAIGARLHGRADIGIGITGIAGPDGGSEAAPVGTVYVSVEYNKQTFTENLKLYELGKMTRQEIRLATVAYCLEAILDAVNG